MFSFVVSMIVILAMKVLRNRTAFVIPMLYLIRGYEHDFYFYERCATFKKGGYLLESCAGRVNPCNPHLWGGCGNPHCFACSAG